MDDSNVFWRCTDNDDVYVYCEDIDKEDSIKLKPQFRYFKKAKPYAVQWRVKDNDDNYKQLVKVLEPKEDKPKRMRKKDAAD
jgi:hypothetical protein